MRAFASTAACVVLTIGLTGCALPIAQTSPGIGIPTTWGHASMAADEATAPTGVPSSWWCGFGSAELNGLVRAAQTDNFDVAAAVFRVQQAHALARIAGAPLLPEANLTGSVRRQTRSDSGDDNDSAVAGTSFGVRLSASYEIDFWGKNRAARSSALATWRATEADRATVALTITASVASTYLHTLALGDRLSIAQRNLDNAQRVLVLVEARSRAGAATPLELAQQRGLVAAQRRVLPALEQQARNSLAALAVLLGRPPQQFSVSATTLDGLTWPATPAGLPSELLTRRPDIARAEAQLAAADANITVARAAMLPSVQLTGSLGVQNTHPHGLLDHLVYSVTAGLTAPIFNAGRLAASRDFAMAQKEELLQAYRAAIVSAFGDVETALNAVDGSAHQWQWQAEELAQAQRAFALAEVRYKAGAETLLTVLDAQRTLYTAQDVAVQLRLARLQAAVTLFKALAGGWEATSNSSKSEMRPSFTAAPKTIGAVYEDKNR